MTFILVFVSEHEEANILSYNADSHISNTIFIYNASP